MAVEIRIDWTANQWRRFYGQADMTPMIEMVSIVADRIALVAIEKHLAALTAGTPGTTADDG